MWVESVRGDNVTIEDYNSVKAFTYRRHTYTRQQLASMGYQYIHFKDLPVNGQADKPGGDPSVNAGANTRVTTISSSSGALTAFYRGSDNHLWTMWQTRAGSTWQGPIELTNVSITDSPTASEPSLKLFEA